MPNWMIYCRELGLVEQVTAKDFEEAIAHATLVLDENKLRVLKGTGLLRGPAVRNPAGREIPETAEYIWEVELPPRPIPKLWATYRHFTALRDIDEQGVTVRFRAMEPGLLTFQALLLNWWSAVRSRWEDPERGYLRLVMVVDFLAYPERGYAAGPSNLL